MKRINDHIASRRTRTPGAKLEQDQLGSAVGGGCCVQGCSGCDLPGIGDLPKFPPGGALPVFP
ncbi:hypothetical protein ENSA5_09590 [Enhygromyxa salina]|uniref:Uncharacterized protein n=1 Tax=Enhygromyxa salina TaxID=215803 RepID=A0A2S9YGU6_9BACT|nr:hypothetical protein [Enhygromyxa salina]PRQ04236.1 hypothetical protein ENSA5_09590 [Enhygromyxa salina]